MDGQIKAAALDEYCYLWPAHANSFIIYNKNSGTPTHTHINKYIYVYIFHSWKKVYILKKGLLCNEIKKMICRRSFN